MIDAGFPRQGGKFLTGKNKFAKGGYPKKNCLKVVTIPFLLRQIYRSFEK